MQMELQCRPWSDYSGSALFVQTYLFENLGSLRYLTGSLQMSETILKGHKIKIKKQESLISFSHSWHCLSLQGILIQTNRDKFEQIFLQSQYLVS